MLWWGVWAALLALAVSACSTPAEATPTVPLAPEMYSDPFEYCAAVGTVDAPDERYTGPQVSDEIIQGYIAAAGLEASTEPMEMFKQTTIWRCMGGQVYACNFGANLPCDAKANTDRTPTQAMKEYCQANPGAEFIPMSVTGRETVYAWHCAQQTPEALEQAAQVDAAGFLANIWYAIKR